MSDNEPKFECHTRSHSESDAAFQRPERIASTSARCEKRELAKAKAKAYKEDKKARRAGEKARKLTTGGVAWGFDPTAGMRSSSDESGSGGCFVSGRMDDPKQENEYEVDDMGILTGRRWTKQGTWGIEHGGPGREGKFEHGSLKGKQAEILSSRVT